MSFSDRNWNNTKYGNFENAVALNAVSGYQTLFLFGRNPDIDSGAGLEDLVEWGTYTFQSSAGPMYITSTNAADVGLVYVVLALDEDLISRTCVVVTNGTTPVQLVGPNGETDFLRANLMFNVTPSGTSSLGDIYLGVDPSPPGGEPADTDKVLLAGVNEQQSNQAVFTVPSDQRGLLTGLVLTTNRNTQGGSSDIYLRTRTIGGGPFRRRTEAGVQVAGSSIIQYNLPYPVFIGQPGTDIVLSAEVTNNNTSLAGGFQLILIHEDM